MVVLRGDDDPSICLAHLGGKVGVLDGLSRIVGGQWKLCDIDEVGLDARALAQFPGYTASCVQAHTPHSGGTENHRDEQWTTCFHKPAPLLRPDCINGPSEDQPAPCLPQCLGRLPYRCTLELDDLAPLFQRPTLSLRWFEILRNIKLNQSRHSNLFRTEHQISFTQLVL